MKGVLIRLCFVHMLGKGQLKSKKLCGKSTMPTATQIIPKIRTVIRDISIRFLCPVPLPCLLVFFLKQGNTYIPFHQTNTCTAIRIDLWKIHYNTPLINYLTYHIVEQVEIQCVQETPLQIILFRWLKHYCPIYT